MRNSSTGSPSAATPPKATPTRKATLQGPSKSGNLPSTPTRLGAPSNAFIKYTQASAKRPACDQDDEEEQALFCDKEAQGRSSPPSLAPRHEGTVSQSSSVDLDRPNSMYYDRPKVVILNLRRWGVIL